MLYIVPNVHQLIQIISLYYISGDPISQNIAKITTFGLEMSSPRPLKLPQKWSKLSADASNVACNKSINIFLTFGISECSSTLKQI